jgi:hypothetical protein
MKMYEGVDILTRVFLTSALVGGDCSFTLWPYPLGKRAPLDRRLYGPQSQSGRNGKVIFLTQPVFEL